MLKFFRSLFKKKHVPVITLKRGSDDPRRIDIYHDDVYINRSILCFDPEKINEMMKHKPIYDHRIDHHKRL